MAFRVSVVCFGRGRFVSMFLLGCRLSINGLSIGLNACCYSKGKDFGEDLRLFVNTVVGLG